MTYVHTIGYEALKPREFFARLQRCGVEALVDVRDLAVSRKTGFSKGPLSALCEQNDLEYSHIPALGCPRDVRHRYREDGDWARYTVAFKAYLADQDKALAEVAQLAGKRRICLLCYEEDYNFCHRTYVAQALAPLIGGAVQLRHLCGPTIGQVVLLAAAEAA